MKILNFAFLGLMAFTATAHARGGTGESSIGVGLILTAPSQDDVNAVIDSNNTSQSRATNKLGTAYELTANYQTRFSGSIFALQFRPSYFTQSSNGSGYDVKLNGFTFFPILRIYPLENSFIHFFLQTGIGYGKLNGSMSGPNGSLNWTGDAFGAMGGLGAEFSFTPDHALVIEGNLRYLPIQRNIASSVSGTPSGFSQANNDQELEYGGQDLKTTLSGIQGIIGYQMMF
jgi:hypothetical protein